MPTVRDQNCRVKYIEPTNERYEMAFGEGHRIQNVSNEAVLNPLEDYCMAIDLYVCIPDRNSCGFANETGEQHGVIFSSTKNTISFMHGTDGAFTTRFTDVNSLNPTDSIAECLGIESIDISFDSWQYPQVTIRFVDVRGAALMLPEEYAYQNNSSQIQSLFSALFSIPYPIFKLQIKGFYGKGTTFLLCPYDTHIELESSTGNFIIVGKFIGHRFKIFADMPMPYVCIGPYLSEGREYWENETKSTIGRFKFRNRDGSTSPMCTFPELRQKIAEAVHSSVQKKAMSQKAFLDNNGDDLKRQLETLKTTFPCNGAGWHATNKGFYFITSSSNDKKKNVAESVKNYFKTLEDYCTAAKSYINTLIDGIKKYKDEDKITEIVYSSKAEGNKKSAENGYTDTDNSKYKNTIGADDDIKTIIAEKIKGSSADTYKVFALPLTNAPTVESDFLTRINEEIKKIDTAKEEREKKYKEEENIRMEQALGFSPSIENIYNLAFAHMDTFMHCFYLYMKNIKDKYDGKDVSRLAASFGNVKNDVRNIGGEALYLPPFPAFYTEQAGVQDGGNVLVWVFPEDLPGNYGSGMTEVEFVKDIITASKTYYEENLSVDEEIQKLKDEESAATNTNTNVAAQEIIVDNSPAVKLNGFVPVTTYDLTREKSDATTNPYRRIKDRKYTDEKIRDEILTAFMIRAMYYLSTLESVNNARDNRRNPKMKTDAKAIGDVEALNLSMAIGEDYADPTFRKFVKEFSNSENHKDLINFLVENIVYDDEKKTKVFKISNDLVGFNVHSFNDKATDTPNKYPIGHPCLYEFKGLLDNLNYGTIPERPAKTGTPPKTFFYYSSRDYVENINKKLKKWKDIVGVGGKDDPKYDFTENSTISRLKDNMDSEYSADDINFNKNIVVKRSDGKTPNIFSKFRLGTDDLNSLANEYMIKYPFGFGDNGYIVDTENIFWMGQTSTPALAYLFLMALAVNDPNGTVFKKDDFQACGIHKKSANGVVPKTALLREGAIYWRERYMDTHSGEDPIVTPEGAVKPTKEQTYLVFTSEAEDNGHVESKRICGYLTNGSGSEGIYTSWARLSGETLSRKNELISFFETWAMQEFAPVVRFLGTKELYVDEDYSKGFDYRKLSDDTNMVQAVFATANNTVENLKAKDAAERVQNFLTKTFFEVYTVFDLYAGREPMKTGNNTYTYDTCKFYADKEVMAEALKSFMDALAKIYKAPLADNFQAATVELQRRIESDPFKNKDLRLSVYQTLKSLYDKWFCAPFKGERTWRFTGPRRYHTSGTEDDEISEFSKFAYIDTFYRNIGFSLLVNASNVSDWISQCLPNAGFDANGQVSYNGMSVHDFLCSVASDVGGMLLAFPQSIGDRSADDVANMFTVYPYNSDWEEESSSFVFIYTYKLSEHLGTNQYPDDGFQLNTEQLDFIGDSEYSIPAFGVSYGKQNQSIFKNITLTTQDSNITEAAIYATMDIASRGSTGARESKLFGQDLYKIKTSYAYQCEFDMMGCSQIMPLMYFQLNNVPFWRGAYLIIKVKHQISQGDMVTHVTGVRINRNALPLTEGDLVPVVELTSTGSLGSIKVYSINGTYTSTTDAPADIEAISGYELPATNAYGKATNWNKDLGENVTEQKPVIAVWPAHSPSKKPVEHAWSKQLVDEYIVPLLKVFNFGDGTSFEKNIQRCLPGDSPAYTGDEVACLCKKFGSKKVISLVPHWNTTKGKYFIAQVGRWTLGGPSKNSNSVETRRADSTKFGFYAAREAWKVIDRKNAGEFPSIPENAIGALSNSYRTTETFPVENGSVRVWSSKYTNEKDPSQDDPAYRTPCAGIITENWFADYKPVSGEGSVYLEKLSDWTNDTHKFDTDANGRYKTMQAWLWSEEGLRAIGYLNAMAIVNYISSLGGGAPSVDDTRLEALRTKNPTLVEKFEKWFRESNK